MAAINRQDLLKWCLIPVEELARHEPRVAFEVVETREEMGRKMAAELVEEVKKNNSSGRATRAIIPCGPMSWYEPFAQLVNSGKVSLRDLVVFHMDECLDWQGNLLPKGHPYNFRSEMEKVFYGPIAPELSVPEESRFWLTPQTMEKMREQIWKEPIDITLGGWGQDGHIAYNQDPVQQLGHGDRSGPAHLWNGLPVRPADVGDPGSEGMPLGEKGSGFQRHRRLETDRFPGGSFFASDS